MPQRFGISQPICRIEDRDLILGKGHYTDDMFPGKGLAVFFLRTPFAHSRLTRLDLAPARKAPGVRLVAGQADLDADGIGGVEMQYVPDLPDGKVMTQTTKPAMVRDKSRFAGDAVAMVVAETRNQARDAAEMIIAEYESLPAVTDVLAAMADDAPQLYDEYPRNIAFEWHHARLAETRTAFAEAEAGGGVTPDGKRIFSVDVVNNRVMANSLETRPMLARPMASGDGLEIWTGCQGVAGIAGQIAKALGLEPQQVHLRTGEVGGAFGYKIFLHPEQIAVAWAARKLGELVRWHQDRSEAFISDIHGRDNRSTARALVSPDGRIHAYEATIHANMGGWISNNGAFIPTAAGSGVLTGCYDIPLAGLVVKGIMTNTPPVDAYRGAGRPEANYLIERLLDRLARELGLAPDTIRARNLIRPDQLPYKMANDMVLDSGEIEALMRETMQRAGWKGFAARREQSAKAGKRRGIGLGLYLERCGGGEEKDIGLEFGSDGTLTVLASQQDNGQAHRTTLTQILSDTLGYDAEKITIVQGDSLRTPAGFTGGARMTAVLGSTIFKAAGQVIERARVDAAARLEAPAEEIMFDDGIFTAPGTNRSVTMEELVIAAGKGGEDGRPHPYTLKHSHMNDAPSFPYGCHVAEIEVDPATCAVEILRYTITDDLGRVINPLTLAGQIHGGVAQGVGQALMEYLPYDEDGQLLAGSLMDYALPRADSLPNMDIATRNTLCKNNPLGVKGAGEAGAICAPQTMIAALCNALDIDHIDMPATPGRIWERMNGG